MPTRIDLRRAIGEHCAKMQGRQASFDVFYDTAMALIQSERAVRAFRLEDEPPSLRQRYGMTKFGQSLLLARRRPLVAIPEHDHKTVITACHLELSPS